MTFETTQGQKPETPEAAHLRKIAIGMVATAEQTAGAIVATRSLGTGSVEFTHAIVNGAEVGVTRRDGEVTGTSIRVTDEHGRRVTYSPDEEGGVNRRYQKRGAEVRQPVSLDELNALKSRFNSQHLAL